MTRLTLSGVSFGTIVEDISVGWNAGQLVGLIGPNGAGKSTLLRLMAGVRSPDQGRVELDGQDIRQLGTRARARAIAYLPQQIPEDVPFSVYEFVRMGRYSHPGSTAADNEAAVREALRRMNLEHEADVPLTSLSGGERQRAGVARCLAQESRVLLLDEPIASLDLYYQLDILQHLQNLTESGYLVVLAIHHLELAIRFCSDLLLLHKGKTYGSGEVQEVLSEEALADVFGVSARTYWDPFVDSLRLSLIDRVGVGLTRQPLRLEK